MEKRMINSVKTMYFSPEGNVRKIVRTFSGVCGGVFDVGVEETDITPLQKRNAAYRFSPSDLVVVGSPVYAGRIPNKVLPFFREMMSAENTPAVILMSYGNRSYGSAPVEMSSVLRSGGFVPVAAAAIVSEHAFSRKIAGGRPDAEDLLDIERFAQQINQDYLTRVMKNRGKLFEGMEIAPYYIPLGTDGQPVSFLKSKPKTRGELCDHCGACAARCPMEAIDTTDVSQVPGTCIKCQACVKVCHTGAKYFDNPAFISHVKMLERDYLEKQNSFFFTL